MKKLTIEESLNIIKNAGLVCERWRGDHYVMDHLDYVEVPRFVHSKLGETTHVFSLEDDDLRRDMEMAELRIDNAHPSCKYEMRAKYSDMDRPVYSKPLELPMSFWKSSFYKGGEDSRAARWIQNRMFLFLRDIEKNRK